VIGGVAGAGIAVGPILGGWATTELSWRVVFAGEVVLVAFILATVRFVRDAERSGPPPRIDVVGSLLIAGGLGAVVLGTLQSSTWGLVEPKDSPVEPLGFSLAIFVIAGGGVLIWAFVRWQRHREAAGTDPLVHLDLLKVLPLRSGLMGLFTQNLILMGVFFVVPLYLQLVLGFDAMETGVRMLPISVMMLVASAVGSRLSTRLSVRSIVRIGLAAATLSIFLLLAVVQPEIVDIGFAVSMAGLGVGMGLIVSQLGNVVQSSVDASGRGEAGGLQYTGQQLGSSLGVALIGAVVLTGLANVSASTVEEDPRVSDEVADQVAEAVQGGLDFLSADQVARAAEEAGLDEATADALVEDYEIAQIHSLKAGLLAAGLLALLSLAFTRNLPSTLAPPEQGEPEDGGDPAVRRPGGVTR
jgi:predicted MFS family arabinose efflux permease